MAKSMKIQVSNPMVAAIKKALKKYNIGFEEIKICKKDKFAYMLEVGHPEEAEHYGDYDFRTDTYKCIQIVYPYNYYAPSAYLTTKRLQEIWNECPDKTFDCLMEHICSYIEI